MALPVPDSYTVGLGASTPTHSGDHDNIRNAVDIRVQTKDGGLEDVSAVGNVGSTETLSLTAGNIITVNNDASCTYTMPSGLTSGKGISFTLVVTNKGAFTATFTGVKWASAIAPTLTSGDTKVDIFTFLTIDGGTTWYGTCVQDVR